MKRQPHTSAAQPPSPSNHPTLPPGTWTTAEVTFAQIVTSAAPGSPRCVTSVAPAQPRSNRPDSGTVSAFVPRAAAARHTAPPSTRTAVERPPPAAPQPSHPPAIAATSSGEFHSSARPRCPPQSPAALAAMRTDVHSAAQRVVTGRDNAAIGPATASAYYSSAQSRDPRLRRTTARPSSPPVPVSPAPPRAAAYDSPAVRSACSSRVGSSLSLASERSDDEEHLDAPMSPVQAEDGNNTRRTRRRRRSSDEAIGEAKRCCSVRSPAQDVNMEGVSLMAAANGPTNRGEATSSRRRKRKSGGKGRKPKPPATKKEDEVPKSAPPPPRGTQVVKGKRGAGTVPMKRATTTAPNTTTTTTTTPQVNMNEITTCAIQLLMDIMNTIRQGQSPEQVILDGLAKLLILKDERSATNARYRGLAVLVKRRVVHQEAPSPPLSTMYALGVQLHVAGEDIRLYACYKPPSTRLDMSELRSILEATESPAILAGDMNCKHAAWNAQQPNQEGRRLFNYVEARGYTVSGPETPTHYPDNPLHMPDVLDIVIHRGLHCQIAQEVIDDDLQSDHQPVLVVLSGMPTRLKPLAPRRSTDWTKFTEKLEATTPTRPITTAADVDLLADDVTACVKRALEEATTQSQPQGRGLQPPLPPRIHALVVEKRRLRKQWQQLRCPTLKSQLNRLAERVKAELQDLATASWEERIDDAAGDWQSTHRLCRQLTGTAAPVRPLLASDGAYKYVAEDRAEVFAEHLERQFRPNPTDEHEHVAAVEQHLRDYFAPPIAHDEDPIFFSPGAVRRAILRTKPRKAPGADGITNTALRHLPYRMVAALARLFTGILRTGAFPTAWKEGRVIMLPKAGKNVLKPESYRPITLLPTISKVFEKLLLRHLTPHITPRPEQFGFRAEHSTTLQLSRVLHLLSSAMIRKEYGVAVFLDMEKAFDRVWHDGLVYKLATSDTPRRVVKVVQAFLSHRLFRVVVDGALSAPRPVAAGVPQGSCVSPACYSRYTDDIPTTPDATLALFADDAAYITTSMNAKYAAKKMQRALDLLPWLAKWRLSVNVSKTQALVTGLAPLPPRLKLCGAEIEWAPRAKYLGVTIDRRLTMGAHARNVAAQGRAVRHRLKPVLSSRLPVRVKLGIYKAYIRPVLTYAAPAWFALTCETNRVPLRAQQHLALRSVVDAPHIVRNDIIQRDLGMESLDEFVRRLATGMFARADASAWPHVKHLAPWHARPPDARRLPRDLVAGCDSPPPD
ncbi:hypothetical protein PYW07_009608 [Mythimna separata]|uniref:Reverse transcriptase domain-containing protein n=1 Tax=Mythimna separata TaxID=271217 RepID=A0AAD8DNG9_MYTSE|nr:hypothetical protein PYW07_009608 [Mythimna separata]